MTRINTTLQLFYQNVRSLRTKTDVFFNNIHLSNADIILITKTWLCDGILDTELCSSGKYDIFRRDRGSFAGGVMIASAPRLAATIRNDFCRSDLE